MTSLFHRRTRSASAQRPQTPMSNSAHVAANQAFLASYASSSNLSASASAAAAALRTMSPPPTSVADLQTKRMLRRSSSASAINAPRGRGRGRGFGGLERTPSTGSMTERTFRRSPSPGRPAAPVQAQPAPPPPPVPKLPPQLPAKTQRRAASLDTGPPPRLGSPPITKAGARGSSVQPTAPRPNAQTTAAVLVTNPQRLAAMQKPERRNSINFSRPLSPPPPPSPVSRSPVLVNGISPAEAEQVTASVTNASQHPVKKKKKKLAPQLVEGSHLHAGHMEAKPVITALAPLPATVPDCQTQSVANDTTIPSPVASLASQDSDSDSMPEKSRRQMRASGALAKQPSVVREDWEGEQQHEREMADTRQREAQGLSPVSEPLNAVQGRKSLATANVSRKLGEPTSPTPTQPSLLSQAATGSQRTGQVAPPSQARLLAADNAHVLRAASASPTRAHFPDRLASDMAAGQKHDPLPRSVSPAKSALKHPSSPGRVGAESRVRGSSVTPSDASDLSTDGQARRKKSVRVSFGAAVDTIGVAAGPVDPDSPQALSPQYAEQGIKGIYGSGKPSLATISSYEEPDEHIQPRPQLPSFGSVRSKARRTDSSDAVNPPRTSRLLLPPTTTSASASSSEPSSSSVSQASVENVSSDHAIGAVFAQEAQRKAQQAALPERPPTNSTQVGSVEAPVLVSSTETNISANDRRHLAQARPLPTPLVKPVQGPTTVLEPTAVPALAVQPPTPGSEIQNPADQWALDVPGGFPVSSDDLSRTPDPTASSTPTASSASAPPAQSALTLNALGTTGGAAANEDSDHDSIYSDAEEDLSDRDGDGFASIDAVVESPIVRSALTHLPSPPASPLADRPPGARNTAWDAAQQRWSGIAQQSRQARAVESPQPEQAASLQTATLSQPPIPKKKKKKPSAVTAAAIAAADASGARRAPPQTAKIQGSASAPVASTARPSASFHQSMRTPAGPGPNEPPALRQSMRAPAAPARDPSFRHSMRPPPAASAAEPKARPKSMIETPSTPPSQPRATLQKKHIPSATVSRSASSKLAAMPSNDSDSESSFKRTRRKTAASSAGAGAGVYTMRRSMRASPSDVPSHNQGRGVVRSLSPPRRPLSPRSEQKPFRSTMRVSTDPPLLPKRSSSLFSASRKAISPVRSPGVSVAASPAARPSRIVDSDEENVPKRKKYTSRFVDSSDDDEDGDAPALRPVRGIPRKNDEGDSTDLEDSSDDEPKQKTHTTAAAAISPPMSSPPTPKKKGFLSIFRNKKKGEDVATAQADDDDGEENQQANAAELSNLGFASAAERDAIVAQTIAKLEATKQANGQQGTTTARVRPSTAAPVLEQESGYPAVHGRLQRRISSPPVQDSWPLPSKAGASADQHHRPSTSSGLLRTNGSILHPNALDRVPSSETAPTVTGRSGKKKRFPMLRKAFGLKD